MNDTATITPPARTTGCASCAPWACYCAHLGRLAAQKHDLDPLDDTFAALAPGAGQ